jgi:hypothetical protein
VTSAVRPTLLNGCASAATAAEARYRIEGGPITGRSARVIALDAGAAAVVDRVAQRPWTGARFFTAAAAMPLAEELADADLVVMVASTDDGAADAELVARACAERGIMLAGLILGDPLEVGAAVSALRPWAPVLMTSGDEDDVSELLTALRA